MDYQLIDADEHCYEPDDCFSRPIEARFKDQTISVSGASTAWAASSSGPAHVHERDAGRLRFGSRLRWTGLSSSSEK